MCGCGLKPNFASIPARSIIRAKPALLNGAPEHEGRLGVLLALEPPQRSRSRRGPRGQRESCSHQLGKAAAVLAKTNYF
jgi:hypothetical protein